MCKIFKNIKSNEDVIQNKAHARATTSGRTSGDRCVSAAVTRSGWRLTARDARGETLPNLR